MLLLVSHLLTSSAAFVLPTPGSHSSTAVYRASARAALDDVPEPEMDMGLLKLPRLTTPERVGFEKFRDRQRARRDAPQAKPESVLLGLHPVEGDPVDLRASPASTQHQRRRSKRRPTR